MNGILPIYKPVGITSYDVIRQVKKLFPRGTKIGHAGTLDPFAEGVLLILLGTATKRFEEIQTWRKTYLATASLGARSETLDCTGKIEIKPLGEQQKLEMTDLKKASEKFVGEIEQVVPAYAAAKYRGRKLYEYARKGIIVPEKKKKVIVYSIEVLSATTKRVEMRIVCSSGTYIRQLSYDVLRELGVESYLAKLTREAIGKITLSTCSTTDHLDSLQGKVELFAK